MKRRLALGLLSASLAFGTPVFADSVNYADVTAPRIESILIQPSVIDTSNADAYILITVTASDDLNAMQAIDAYTFITPTVAVQTNDFTLLSTKVEQGRIWSTWQAKLTFRRGTPAGTHKLSVRIDDAAGNRQIDQLARDPLPGNSFEITNTGVSPQIDVSAYDVGERLAALERDVAAAKASLAASATRLQSVEAEAAAAQSEANAAKRALVAANAKLKRICSARPKPKGC